MASVFQRPDSKSWFAAYRAADGRRVKVATKTADKKEAQRIADRLELESSEGQATRKASASLSGVNDAMQRATHGPCWGFRRCGPSAKGSEPGTHDQSEELS
jgi:hypothetical protein